jgi:uncharacterized protein YbjT (DUF2867 family)
LHDDANKHCVQLLEAIDASVRALVRDEQAEQVLRRFLGPLGHGLEVLHADVCDVGSLPYAFKGVDAVVIATGPAARMNIVSHLGASALGMVSFGYASAKPSYWFDDRSGPNQVDWIGQSNQIDAAREAGASHVVLLSSMGGTKPDHLLNQKMERIALHKRKAEHYLVRSGVPFTILRAGGLFAAAAADMQRSTSQESLQLTSWAVGVNDEAAEGEWEHTALPPDELADLLVQCLEEPTAVGRSFDIWRSGGKTTLSGKIGRYVGKCEWIAILAKLGHKNGSYDSPPFSPRQVKRRQPAGLLDIFSDTNCGVAPSCEPDEPCRAPPRCEDCGDKDHDSYSQMYEDSKTSGAMYQNGFLAEVTPNEVAKSSGGFNFADHWHHENVKDLVPA